MRDSGKNWKCPDFEILSYLYKKLQLPPTNFPFFPLQLPWKTLKNIVEYYYMWKTTDRYVQQKRVKAVEAESKLKQVYIPNYTKPNPALITNNNTSKSNLLNGTANGNNNDILALTTGGGKPCESCSTTSSPNWYSWGPSHLSCRLCQSCWNYWKKYGGLKTASRLSENEGGAT